MGSRLTILVVNYSQNRLRITSVDPATRYRTVHMNDALASAYLRRSMHQLLSNYGGIDYVLVIRDVDDHREIDEEIGEIRADVMEFNMLPSQTVKTTALVIEMLSVYEDDETASLLSHMSISQKKGI
jgi:hypothetical protein